MTAGAIPSQALGACWFKSPIDIEDWIRSARRLWGWLKDRRRHRNKEHRVRDRDLARDLGCSRRSVQRGLWFLELVGAIVRRRTHGEHSGRVIVIVLPLAGDNKTEAKPGRKPAARPSPVPPPAPASAPPAPPEPPPTAEEQKEAVGGLRAMMAKILAEQQQQQQQAPVEEPAPALPSAPKKLRGVPHDLRYVELKLKLGEKLTAEEQALLDAARGNRGP